MSLLGVVLAGGRSSRMGQDKAELVWQGYTLLENQARLLKKVGCDAVLIAGRQVDGWPSLPDDQPFRGPVGALAHVLKQIDAMFALAPGKLLLLPVDMPLLSPESLKPLINHSAPLVAYNHHPLPCVMRVTPEIRQIIARHALRPGASFRGLWGAVAGAVWSAPPGQPEALTNINTMQEWHHLHGMPENTKR